MKSNRLVEAFAGAIRAVAFLGAVWMTEFDNAAPENWDQLTMPQIEEICTRMLAAGCNLAWVPRGTLVEEIVETPDADPIGLLATRRDQVAEDQQALLATIEHPQMALRVQAAEQACRAFANGDDLAAQATASAVVTDVAHELTSQKYLGPVKRALVGIDLEQATILDRRRRTVRRLIGAAMEPAPFDMPGPYRRSASLHGLSTAQYNERNAICALQLMTGALCELREEYLFPDLANAHRWHMGVPRRVAA